MSAYAFTCVLMLWGIVALTAASEFPLLEHADLVMTVRNAVTLMEDNLLQMYGTANFNRMKSLFPKIFGRSFSDGQSDAHLSVPSPNPNNLVPCQSSFGWGNLSTGHFPSYEDAIKMGGGDVPNIGVGVQPPSHVPKMKKVVVIGKGGSSRPIQKTDDIIIVTVNHALAWQNYSDIHFGADYYFQDVPLDFFCRARALVLPTYFHVSGDRHVHVSVLISKLKFPGPIFLFQLPDGPKDEHIEMWDYPNAIRTSGELAIAWMLSRGYRVFETFGIGSDAGYADFYVSETYQKPKTFLQSQVAHSNSIAKRIKAHGATWIRH